MSAVKITVTEKPTSNKTVAALEKTRRKLADFTGFHKKAAILLDRWVQKNFKTEGGLLKDGKWAPFALGGRATTKAKANAASIARSSQSLTGERRGLVHIDGTAKLLQLTGTLRIKHIPFHSKHNAGIGSDVPYAKTHQLGLGPVPVRRTLPKDVEVRKQLLDLLDLHAQAAS